MQIEDVYFDVELEDIINFIQANTDFFPSYKPGFEDVMVSCPYHKNGQERRPSAGIRRKDGMFHCFACGETHSLPEVISYVFGYDDSGVFGWAWLLRSYLNQSVRQRKGVELDLNREPTKKEIQYVDESELADYRYFHPYMFKRKLTKEIIELFDIGYDHETDCITFPQRDLSGRTLFVARRSVKGKYFNYPAKSEKPIYGLYELSTLPTFPRSITICESMLDALTVWVYGDYAVALNGLGTQSQIDTLNKLPCRTFILGLDNDTAGKRGADKLRKKLKGKMILQYEFPEGIKDINELSYEGYRGMNKFF